MTQVPLHELLAPRALGKGNYQTVFPPSVCFGNVVAGGLIMSLVHCAACDFASRELKRKTHTHVLHISTRFFRPLFAEPKECMIVLKTANLTKAMSTLHFDVQQGKSVCTAGYVTLVASKPSSDEASRDTGWSLSPPASPVSVEDLQHDRDPDWVSYLTPYSPLSHRNPQSYMRYFLPITTSNRHTIDHWITPGWLDSRGHNSPLWTTELIHFVVDNGVPLLNDLMETDREQSVYQTTVAAGREQRRARAEGKDDRIWGKGLTESDGLPWITSTIAITTEIKKPLSEQGERWLFMRATAKNLVNSRLDMEIILLNVKGELVALSNQIAQVIPLTSKMEKKKSKAAL